ncbi:hypothetical protein SUGI_0946500 [Cryptomeria japonica]|nr:hypothetical protein SUGI_0946500 [Cryptomeria japonica]
MHIVSLPGYAFGGPTWALGGLRDARFRIEEYHRISNTILAKEKWKGRRSVQMELKQARAALKKVYKIRSGTHDPYEIVWQ